MMGGVTDPILRRARATDVAALTALAEAAYRHYLPRIGRPPGPMVDDYAALVRDAETWVLEEDERIVALLVLMRNDDHLLLDNIAVAPDRQGSGLGRRLLAYAEARALAQGLPEVRLYTNEAMTENLRLYARYGYVETHRAVDNGFHRVYLRKPVS
jgi:ribosomal protein S18 acetylase RimI-like enzyme